MELTILCVYIYPLFYALNPWPKYLIDYVFDGEIKHIIAKANFMINNIQDEYVRIAINTLSLQACGSNTPLK